MSKEENAILEIAIAGMKTARELNVGFVLPVPLATLLEPFMAQPPVAAITVKTPGGMEWSILIPTEYRDSVALTHLVAHNRKSQTILDEITRATAEQDQVAIQEGMRKLTEKCQVRLVTLRPCEDGAGTLIKGGHS